MNAQFSLQLLGLCLTALLFVVALGTLLYSLIKNALISQANEARTLAQMEAANQQVAMLKAQTDSVSSLEKSIQILEGRVAYMESEKARQKIKEHSDGVRLEYFEQALRLILDSNIPDKTRAAFDEIMLKDAKQQQECQRALNAFDADNSYLQELRFKAITGGSHTEAQKAARA